MKVVFKLSRPFTSDFCFREPRRRCLLAGVWLLPGLAMFFALTAHAGKLASSRRGGLHVQEPGDPLVPWTTPARKVFAAVARSLGGLDA